MLLILIIRPVMEWMGKDTKIQDVVSQISQETDAISFKDDAREAREKQVQKGVRSILEEYGMKAQEIKADVDEKGEIQEITITADDGKSQERRIKKLVSRFYNVKEANINISE